MTQETIEHRVLDYASHLYSQDTATRHDPTTQKSFVAKVSELFGKDAGKVATRLFREGYLMFNNYGYINLSDRGYTLYDKNIETPRRKNRSLKGLTLKTQCEECGKLLGSFFALPAGFRVICQECYEDFKYRRSPEQMHYRKKSSSVVMK